VNARPCIDCGAPAEWAFIDEAGELLGWICDSCDAKRRRRRMGWRRRVRMRVRHAFKL
jgi:hypothetical protein